MPKKSLQRRGTWEQKQQWREEAEQRCTPILSMIQEQFFASEPADAFENLSCMIDEMTTMQESLTMEDESLPKPKKSVFDLPEVKFVGREPSGPLADFSKTFCRKWKVKTPAEITCKNPEAREEWTQAVADIALDKAKVLPVSV